MRETLSILFRKILDLIFLILLLTALFFLIFKFFSLAEKVTKYIDKKSIEKGKMKINQFYGTDKLLKDLGRKNLSYPIIYFGGQWIEPGSLSSCEEYTTEYLYPGYSLGAEYLVDAQGNTYGIQKEKIHLGGEKNIQQTCDRLKNLYEKKEFKEVRDQIIAGIKNTPDSEYYGLEKKIANAENFEAIAKIIKTAEE